MDDEIRIGDRVEVDTGVPGIDVQWGRATLVTRCQVCVVFDHSVKKIEHSYLRHRVRKLGPLEWLVDPVEDPGEEFYEHYHRMR
jgi:hypothetical protein